MKLEAAGSRANLLNQRIAHAAFPLPKKPKFMGCPSMARIIISRLKWPGVQVVGGPVAGPVLPPYCCNATATLIIAADK